MANNTRVALVVGASRGIGKQCALALAGKGFDVAAAARTLEGGESFETSETSRASVKRALPGSLRELANEIEGLGRKALPVAVDLMKNQDLDRLFQRTMDEFGRIDVLVHAQKYVGPGHRDLFIDTPYEAFHQAMQVNVMAALYLLKLVVPVMIKQQGGVVVNVASNSGHRETPQLPNGDFRGPPALTYGVSKAAINRVGPGLAKELRQYNITVFNLEPGRTWTERKVVQRGDGYDTSVEVPPEASGRTCAFIATAPNPLFYSGMTVNAPEFAIDHGLIDPERIPPPHGKGQWGLPNRTGSFGPVY